MIPFLFDKNDFKVGDYIYVENVKTAIESGKTEFDAVVISEDKKRKITLKIDALTSAEKEIILKGCLINYYRN